MKKAFLVLALSLLSLAVPAHGQATFLELGLHWGTFSGLPVSNATTTLSDSKGNVIATRVNNAFPVITVPVSFDIYTVTVKAPAINGNPAVNWLFTLPMATTFPIISGDVTIKSYVAAVAIDSTGQHGTIKATIQAAF